jgi:putative protease
MAARRRKSPGRKTARRPKAKPKGKPGKRPARARQPARRKSKPAAAPRPRPRPKRKPAASQPRTAAAPPLVAGAPVEVGVVLHYYARAAAGVVALSRPIHRGDTIHVRGQTTDFVQSVQELALDGAPVSEGTPPQQIGVRFAERARAGDRVYRVSW